MTKLLPLVTSGIWERGRMQESGKVYVCAWEELCGQIPSHFTSSFIYFYSRLLFFKKQHQQKSHQHKEGMRIYFGVQQAPYQSLLFRPWWLPLPSGHSRANPRQTKSSLLCFRHFNGWLSALGNMTLNGSPRIQANTSTASKSESAVGPLKLCGAE